MARISVVTFTYTVLLAYLYLLSKGWQTLAFQMTRDQATACTMVMAIVYLSYSSYFLSVDFDEIRRFMKVIMALLYFYHGFKNFKNLRLCLDMIQDFINETIRNNPHDIMVTSLRLTLKLLK